MRHLFTLLLIAGSVFAATYYVAKTGDDGNVGSEAAPWLTIGKGVATAVAGDTVWVKAGSYAEFVHFLTHDGTANNRIVFKAYDGLNSIIAGPVLFEAKACNLEGFQIVYDSAAWGLIQAVKFDEGGDSSAILDCDIKPLTANSTYGHGILCTRRGVTIHSNTVHDFGTRPANDHGIYLQGSGCTVTNNTVYGSASMGIHLYTEGVENPTESCVVAYNVIHDNGAGILVAGNHNQIHHNVCYGNDAYGLKAYYGTWYGNEFSNNVCYGEVDGMRVESNGANVVRNNLFLGNIYHLSWWAAGSGTTVDYNCYWPDSYHAFYFGGNLNYAAWLAASGQDSHSICVDPLLVDTAAHDFHLQAGSPCIGAGYGGCDIGAFPFVPESIPETNPPPHKPKKPRGKSGSQSTVTIYFQRLGNGQVYDVTGRRVEGRVIFDNRQKRVVVR